MENVINGTPKATFYLNELASEITEFVIDKKYENTGVNTMVEKRGVMFTLGIFSLNMIPFMTKCFNIYN